MMYVPSQLILDRDLNLWAYKYTCNLQVTYLSKIGLLANIESQETNVS